MNEKLHKNPTQVKSNQAQQTHSDLIRNHSTGNLHNNNGNTGKMSSCEGA